MRLVLLLMKGLGGLRSGYSRSFLMISRLCVMGTVINLWGLGWLRESVGVSLVISLVMLVLQVGGCALGWMCFVLGGVGVMFSSSRLFYSDSLVERIYSCYLCLRDVSFVSFYR